MNYSQFFSPERKMTQLEKISDNTKNDLSVNIDDPDAPLSKRLNHNNKAFAPFETAKSSENLEDTKKDENEIQNQHEHLDSSDTKEFNEENDINYVDDSGESKGDQPDETGEKNEGLSEEEKELIRKETGWSDEIIDHIENMNQYEIYKNADLHEEIINGKHCLCKNIDMDYVDPKTGLTNRELMEKGRAPIDSKTGEKIELHHMGQDPDGPFAELDENSEHGDGNYKILHTHNSEVSWRKDIEKKDNFNNVERPEHWKARAEEA